MLEIDSEYNFSNLLLKVENKELALEAEKLKKLAIKSIKDEFFNEVLEQMKNQSSMLKILEFDSKEVTLKKRFDFFLSDNHPGLSIRFLLRCSCLPIEIYQGRKTGIEKSSRFCKLCDKNQIEDSMHFLLECDYFSSLRLSFLNELRSKKIAKIDLPLTDSNKKFLLKLLIGDFQQIITGENRWLLRNITLDYINQLWNARQSKIISVLQKVNEREQS